MGCSRRMRPFRSFTGLRTSWQDWRRRAGPKTCSGGLTVKKPSPERHCLWSTAQVATTHGLTGGPSRINTASVSSSWALCRSHMWAPITRRPRQSGHSRSLVNLAIIYRRSSAGRTVPMEVFSQIIKDEVLERAVAKLKLTPAELLDLNGYRELPQPPIPDRVYKA